MEAWALSASAAELMMDAALLGIALLAATLLRRYVAVFQRYLIPNALLAGLLGLLVGPEVLAIVDISLERMGAYVYHLLALTFICVGLKSRARERSHAAVHLGFMQVLCMLLQGIVGLAIALCLYLLWDSGQSPAAGILLPLGFAMGPGVAYSVGASWAQFGFAEGASVGLTLAAIGFLVAYTLGIALVHRSGYSARDLPTAIRTGISDPESASVAGRLTLSPGAIEPLAWHAGLVAVVYGLSWLLAVVLAGGLAAIGRPHEIPVLWSFHFIAAHLVALLVRRGLDATGQSDILDQGLLDRLTGLFADFLIAASIMAISIGLAWRYALPILLMSMAGAGITYTALRYTARRVFRAYRFERFIGMFGEMTGTVVSGLALIRILDPEYRSPVAQDLVLSSGVALGLAFPLLVAINLPFTAFEGRLEGYLVLLGVMGAYLVVTMTAWRVLFRRTWTSGEADEQAENRA